MIPVKAAALGEVVQSPVTEPRRLMRPLEALLLFADLLALVVVAAPRLRRIPWLVRATLVLLPAAAAAQWWLEGPRWQMAPAYGLAAVLLLALSRPAPTRQHGRFAVHAGVAVVLAFAAVLPLATPVFRFAQPSGPYGVGTLTYHWKDTARPEVFTADPTDRRELMVQVWYPARTDPSAPRAPYLEDGGALAPLARLLGLPAFALGHLKYVTTNAVAGAPVAGGGAYPVLIFAHGRGGYRQHNTFLVEALVSHGYVVAAMDQPYAAATVGFPDGRRADIDPRMLEHGFKYRVIPFLAQDASFTLDRLADLNRGAPRGVLTGRLDLQRAGMFGVSLGGAVTAQACLRDPRLRACLPIDVFMPADVVREGLRQPTLWISRDEATMRREGWSQADIDETQTTMRAVFRALPGAGYLVLIPGAYHPTFSDAPLLAAPPVARWLGLNGPVGAGRAHEIVAGMSQAFFDHHLKGAPAPLLDDPAATYPEVIFEARAAVMPNRP